MKHLERYPLEALGTWYCCSCGTTKPIGSNYHHYANSQLLLVHSPYLCTHCVHTCCRYCQRLPHEHVGRLGKCLFGPTLYAVKEAG